MAATAPSACTRSAIIPSGSRAPSSATRILPPSPAPMAPASPRPSPGPANSCPRSARRSARRVFGCFTARPTSSRSPTRRRSANCARKRGMAEPTDWPRKTRELRNHHLDSRIWNVFKYRPGDVIIASYPKSGTTWTQQIVGQLLSAGVEFPINRVSPWMDARINMRRRLAAVHAHKHRRVLKSHLPLDALVFSPHAKYIYVARDGRDVVWSLHHVHVNATEAYFRMLNDPPGRIGPPMGRADPDIRDYFRRWLREDGYPYWSYWDNVRSWWQARDVSNILLVHFNDLKRDLEGEMRRVATFLGCNIPDANWPKM